MPARLKEQLLQRLRELAPLAIQGNLVGAMVRCGTRSCGCHQDPSRRHGPHLSLKYRKTDGRSASLYVPRSHETEVRRAVEAWAEMWQIMLELGHGNRETLAQRVRRKAKP